MFKVGDKVICIDDEGWDCLIEGQIYIISQILERGKVRLEGLEGVISSSTITDLNWQKSKRKRL